MKLHARNVAWLLPLFLTACFDKPHPTPIQAYAPPVSTLPKPPVMHPDLPESALTLDTESVDDDADAILDEAARPVVKKHKPPPKATADGPEPTPQPAAPPVQQAANETSSVPAIGDLSSGDPADLRRETESTITETEGGLKAIDRPLSGQDEKTAAQIRQFIRQARKALTSGDVDGAHTLASKAKVLLTELSQ